MKKQHRYIVASACLAVGIIVCYQSYWLTDIYATLFDKQQHDIREAMRASDFREIVHRVDALKHENHGGKMDISVGANPDREKAYVSNDYSSRAKEKPGSLPETTKDEVQESKIEYDEFANALKTETEVLNVGLQMQRGIHNGLDQLKPVAPDYFDSVLTRQLDSLGITARHQTLYLHERLAKGRSRVDTLFRSGRECRGMAGTYEFPVNVEKNRKYVLVIEKNLLSFPRQMIPPVLISVVTLLALIAAFWYVIRMYRRMCELDEMKSDFTNNITHELKTPIAVAYAANDALLNFNAKGDPERLKRYLNISQEQLMMLGELVEQILSMSMERRQSMHLNMEDVDVAAVVEKVVEINKLKAKKPLTAIITIPQGMTVQADPMHFRNIINNLVDNAIKYSGQELNLTIVGIMSEDGRKIITVKDNGMGIASEQQPFVFDKFYRVPHGNVHNVKGYGLGLFYVKSLMEKFGGSVSLTSELGVGTVFKLEFNG